MTRGSMTEMYLKLERELWVEESAAPAPALSHSMAKLEKLTSNLEKLSLDLNQNLDYALPPVLNKIEDVNLRTLEDIDNSIERILTELRITKNPKLAGEHEEFIAKLNRKALKQRQAYLLSIKKFEIEEEATKLSEKVQNLQKLYEKLDTVLSKIGTGTAAASPLEMELDRVRNYRDALYSRLLEWQDAAKLSQSASAFAQTTLEAWRGIHASPDERSRFQMATGCRNSIQEAAMSINMAQSILPSVQFPYCSPREIMAILQMIDYLYTDMQNEERYHHAVNVYDSFAIRSAALTKWLNDIIDSTIRKDIEAADEKITDLNCRLSKDRVEAIRKKFHQN